MSHNSNSATNHGGMTATRGGSSTVSTPANSSTNPDSKINTSKTAGFHSRTGEQMHAGAGPKPEHPDTYKNPFKHHPDHHVTSVTDGILDKARDMMGLGHSSHGSPDQSRMGTSAKSTVGGMTDTVKDTADSMSSGAGTGGNQSSISQSAKSTAGGLAETVKDKADSMSSGMGTGDMAQSAKSTADNVTDTVKQKAGSMSSGMGSGNILGSMGLGSNLNADATAEGKGFLNNYSQEMEDDGVTRNEADTVGDGLLEKK